MWIVKAEKNGAYLSTVFRAENLEEVRKIIELHEKYAVEKHSYMIKKEDDECLADEVDYEKSDL